MYSILLSRMYIRKSNWRPLLTRLYTLCMVISSFSCLCGTNQGVDKETGHQQHSQSIQFTISHVENKENKHVTIYNSTPEQRGDQSRKTPSQSYSAYSKVQSTNTTHAPQSHSINQTTPSPLATGVLKNAMKSGVADSIRVPEVVGKDGDGAGGAQRIEKEYAGVCKAEYNEKSHGESAIDHNADMHNIDQSIVSTPGHTCSLNEKQVQVNSIMLSVSSAINTDSITSKKLVQAARGNPRQSSDDTNRV